MLIGANEERYVNPVCTATVLKALLLGHEITIEAGTFRYFRKGEVVDLTEDTVGEVAEEGIFKKCEVVHYRRPLNKHLDEAETSHTWLLWLSTLASFVSWTETITPAEMAVITANLVINQKL
jgi:hypothetical protein